MARLIFISPYLKPGDAAHRAYLVNYMATREGVEKLGEGNRLLPPTKNQEQLVRKLVRDFPLTRETFEYEDYLAAPTREHAHAVIQAAMERNLDQAAKRENYVDYISQRPGAQRLGGEHGLFDADGKVPILSWVAEEVANHPGNVWTPVISLRREDARRLCYADADNWRALLSGFAPELAAAYKIHPDHLRWYAAFHDKAGHPHVHLIIYSTDPREGYLTKKGIAQVKSGLAGRIFRQEMIAVYQRQTEHRNELGRSAEEVMAGLIQRMEQGFLQNDRLEALTLELSEKLKQTNGRKVYGYLPPRAKALVDEIVDELANDARVAEAYRLWYEMREEVLRTYRGDMPARLPLSRQKEFKPVRSMVIREALRLGEAAPTFEDGGMVDEPEAAEEERTHGARACWQQAAEYREDKRVLYEETASPDRKWAARLSLERLWDEGFSTAAHLLGKLYRDGVSVEADEATAEQWFRRSAEAGNDYSEYALGKLLLNRKRIPEALHWLGLAAEHGNQFARYRLGKVYLLGDDVPKDVDKALEYLSASAEQGNQYAQYTLGKLYLMGREVRRDKEQAVEWLKRSSAQGNEYAQFFLEHLEQFRDPSAGLTILRMLRQMGRIFRDSAAADGACHGMRIDRKRRRILREKKMAQGHKSDDHEDILQMGR